MRRTAFALCWLATVAVNVALVACIFDMWPQAGAAERVVSTSIFVGLALVVDALGLFATASRLPDREETHG